MCKFEVPLTTSARITAHWSVVPSCRPPIVNGHMFDQSSAQSTDILPGASQSP